MLVGVSGSGKSAYAREHFKPYQVLSTDGLREQISDSRAAHDAHDDAVAILGQILTLRCQRELVSVVDSTALETEFRNRIRTIARSCGAVLEVACFNTPLQTCLLRNRARTVDERVPDDVIEHQHALFQRAIQDMLAEGYDRVVDIAG
jgi:predicted kinase